MLIFLLRFLRGRAIFKGDELQDTIVLFVTFAVMLVLFHSNIERASALIEIRDDERDLNDSNQNAER